ncbi:UNKNOWN [Stylonychia lemnae]|uniref:Uncharacterized protein n=1 Tax=Stylonychia lemnae TaxID=5949 RepID=A0A078AAF4_STYLE|nr:UNKNOWN [Stylonychia lemnae]|eukprot:CDW79174.1 UNKNOWN [Stylonychia lemnae]
MGNHGRSPFKKFVGQSRANLSQSTQFTQSEDRLCNFPTIFTEIHVGKKQLIELKDEKPETMTLKADFNIHSQKAFTQFQFICDIGEGNSFKKSKIRKLRGKRNPNAPKKEKKTMINNGGGGQNCDKSSSKKEKQKQRKKKKKGDDDDDVKDEEQKVEEKKSVEKVSLDELLKSNIPSGNSSVEKKLTVQEILAKKNQEKEQNMQQNPEIQIQVESNNSPQKKRKTVPSENLPKQRKNSPSKRSPSKKINNNLKENEQNPEINQKIQKKKRVNKQGIKIDTKFAKIEKQSEIQNQEKVKRSPTRSKTKIDNQKLNDQKKSKKRQSNSNQSAGNKRQKRKDKNDSMMLLIKINKKLDDIQNVNNAYEMNQTDLDTEGEQSMNQPLDPDLFLKKMQQNDNDDLIRTQEILYDEDNDRMMDCM